VLALAADPHAFGIVARIAEGRGAAGADPFVAALVAFLLFGEPLLERLHDRVPVAQFLDLGHLLGREEFLGNRFEPAFRNVDRVLAVVRNDSLEDPLEHLVETIEHALVLHEGRAAEIVERLGRFLDHLAVERLQQSEVLLEAGLDPGRP
jgi:hypothetical protein